MLNYKICFASVPLYSGTAGGHKVDSGLHSSLGKTRSVSSSLKKIEEKVAYWINISTH